VSRGRKAGIARREEQEQEQEQEQEHEGQDLKRRRRWLPSSSTCVRKCRCMKTN